jgi:hypothetical protein
MKLKEKRMSEAMVVTMNSTTATGWSSSEPDSAVSGSEVPSTSLGQQRWNEVSATVNKGIYSSAYGLAFGVSFPVLLIAKSLPRNNCIVWGFIDGAKAARSQCDRQFVK